MGSGPNDTQRRVQRVLFVHNWHRSETISGENRVVEADAALLKKEGIDVEIYGPSNDETATFGAAQWANMAIRPIVSIGDARALRKHIDRFRPDIVHVHNVWPLLSPWVVRTARAAGVPVVHTVHNYLHACIAASYFRDGHPCYDCRDRLLPWPGVIHGCSPTSRMAGPVGDVLKSSISGVSLTVHRSTWRLVDRFVPVGTAVARHLERTGIDPERITVRGNPVADPGDPSPPGDGALYAGRFAGEKGIRLLLDAWERSGLGGTQRLRLVGSGPEEDDVRRIAAQLPGIDLVGFVDHARALQLMNESAFVVVPSLWEEPFGLTVVEAMSRGRPVLVTNLGEPSFMIDESCGWVVDPSPTALAAGLSKAFEAPLEALGTAGRQRYEERYAPAAALRRLLEIYDDVLRKALAPKRRQG